MKTSPTGGRPALPNISGDLKPPQSSVEKVHQTCLPQQLPPYGHFPPSPYFSPPPFPYNYPQCGPFFQYPPQQFPYPLNYPLAGQANLPNGAAFFHPPLDNQFVRDQQSSYSYQQGVHQGGVHLQPASSLLPLPASSLLPKSASSLLPQPASNLLPQPASSLQQLPARSTPPQARSSLQPDSASVGSDISLAVTHPKPEASQNTKVRQWLKPAEMVIGEFSENFH